MRAINPSSIKSLGHYIVSGLMDKLRRESDSDFWFKPEVYDRIYAGEQESLRSIDRLKQYHQRQNEIRARWKSLR